MTAKRRNWILIASAFVVLVIAGLAVAAKIAASHIEPYARETAVRYLSQRFNCNVELRALHLRLPKTSLLHLILTQGRGVVARAEGEALVMRLKDRPGAPPLFSIRSFIAEASLESLLHPPVRVSLVTLDGMEIQVPPHGQRPGLSSGGNGNNTNGGGAAKPTVSIARIDIHNAALVLESKDPTRAPLRFAIQELLLRSVQPGAPMKYKVSLTNAKPPGDIGAHGMFGPWNADEPGDTPVTGDYEFNNANLGVFNGISGTLNSTGHFQGQLEALKVNGIAKVPNFSLKMSGNPVPLTARFSAIVDGTNGNTTLQPVVATLGSTNFTTSGAILKHEENRPRSIALDVSMPDGDMHDILRLAMKGSPFMDGRLTLKTKINIPPLTGAGPAFTATMAAAP